eukprot:2249360-Ditylum_brightwellii.AAC.1
MQLLATVCLLIGKDDEQSLSAGHYLPFYAVAIRAKEQEAVNFLEKKVDGMKGYDLNLSVAAAIMCLRTVLGSDFIMVTGGNGALGQAVIPLAAIGDAGRIYAMVQKEHT